MGLLVGNGPVTHHAGLVEGDAGNAAELGVGIDGLERGKVAGGRRGTGGTGIGAGEALLGVDPSAGGWGGERQMRQTEQDGRAQDGKGAWAHGDACTAHGDEGLVRRGCVRDVREGWCVRESACTCSEGEVENAVRCWDEACAEGMYGCYDAGPTYLLRCWAA
jgi:hypothetical protein